MKCSEPPCCHVSNLVISGAFAVCSALGSIAALRSCLAANEHLYWSSEAATEVRGVESGEGRKGRTARICQTRWSRSGVESRRDYTGNSAHPLAGVAQVFRLSPDCATAQQLLVAVQADHGGEPTRAHEDIQIQHDVACCFAPVSFRNWAMAASGRRGHCQHHCSSQLQAARGMCHDAQTFRLQLRA